MSQLQSEPMHVFITGGTGTIGSGVVRTLVAAGHRVTGLVRSDEKAALLQAVGGTPVVGELRDPASYQSIAATHDALVHVGFAPGEDGVGTDRTAITTLIAAARAGSGPRVLIYTSGVLVLGDTEWGADETASTAQASPLVAWRPGHEQLVLDAATSSLVTAVIRPGFVYGGRTGIVAGYFESSLTEGAAVYVGDGSNHMALVHRDDLARLYQLVVERRAQGIFHGVDGAAVCVIDLARAASRAAGKSGATRAMPVDEARRIMGPFADALLVDQVVVARRSAALGWTPAWGSFPAHAAEAFREWLRETGRDEGSHEPELGARRQGEA